MECPKCQGDMRVVSYTGLPINRCSKCHGMWIRPNEFRKLKKDDWLAGVVDEGKKSEGIRQDRLPAVRCPDCGRRMKHLIDEKQPHILYEQCPEDGGVFFDAGELKDLAHQTFWDKFKTRKILDR